MVVIFLLRALLISRLSLNPLGLVLRCSGLKWNTTDNGWRANSLLSRSISSISVSSSIRLSKAGVDGVISVDEGGGVNS